MSTQDELAVQDWSKAVKKWSSKRGNLIMILHEIQNLHGYIPRDVAIKVAKEVDVPLAQIYEVLTFYNYFKITPPGKFVISVCLGTACFLKGGGKIFSALSEELGIGEGQSTGDGLFHLQGVRCLGCCGLAPVVLVNGPSFNYTRIYSKVHSADVKNILRDCYEIEEKNNATAHI